MRGVAFALLLSCSTSVLAQGFSDTAPLRQQLEALRAEQAQTTAKMAALESALNRIEGKPDAAPTATAAVSATRTQAAGPAFAKTPARLQLSGDMRLRYEANFGDRDARNRDRGVLRARLRASYAVNDWLAVGGQIATGDPDDPNSADISLSNFDDDLQVSLDQAWVRGTFGNLLVHGGKIPQPFVRTELVWDGDVSPQGVSAAYKLPLGGSGAFVKATGLYFQVDESVAGPNSDMVGGQLGFETSPSAPVKLELAAAYYDYSLRSTGGGDSGDFRSNLFAGGRYLSDFNLLDVIGAVGWNGLGERWPLRLVGDYVHNFGAIAGATGFGADLTLGRASKQGDWRFGYGYAQTGVDAVLAAFAQDNTTIGTNYRQHSLAVDYVPTPNLTLNATLYRYQPRSITNTGGNDPGDWLNRVRLNMLVGF